MDLYEKRESNGIDRRKEVSLRSGTRLKIDRRGPEAKFDEGELGRKERTHEDQGSSIVFRVNGHLND